MGPKDFETFLRQQGKRAASETYRIAAEKFETYLRFRGFFKAEDMPPDILRPFAEHLSASMAPHSVDLYLRASRAYMAFLRAQGIPVPEPTRAKAPRLQRSGRILKPRELAVYVEYANGLPEPLRSMLLLLTVVPMRVEYFTALEAEHVEIGTPDKDGESRPAWFVVPGSGVGRPLRRVPIVPQGLAILRSYVERSRPHLAACRFLWPSPTDVGDAVSPRQVYRHLEWMGTQRGLAVTPMLLHRTALAGLVAAGVPEGDIAEMWGAKSVMALRSFRQPNPQAIYRAAARTETPWLKGLDR